MSDIYTLVEIFTNWTFQLASQHGILITLLAILGAFAIISAIGSKVYQAIKYLFMIFIAIPAIIVIGLFNKSNRKERVKELGEIRAFIKEKPDRWKRLVYYFLLCLFIMIIALIVYWFLNKFIFPFKELNDFSKIALQNYTN